MTKNLPFRQKNAQNILRNSLKVFEMKLILNIYKQNKILNISAIKV